MAEDLLLNLDLAKVQAAVLPHLESRFSGDCTANFSRIGKDTLTRMRRIQERIEMIAPSSPLWKGLDAQSEVSVLKFACHSVSTIILHLLQDCQASPLETRDSYLESARQGLSSLMSMSLSAEKQSAVAFLHWTLLFYPISAYFVLFCNVVATSNIADFNLLKATVDCLAWGEAKSAPIAQIRSVLQYFVHLSRGVFKGKTTIPGALGDFQYQVQPQPSQFLSSLNSFPSSWNSDCERIQSHSDEVENCPETFFYSLQGLGSPDHDIFDFLENQFENA
ncbi:hypothetical protein N7456_003035 [Penicillium angulare]|uniref:C6 transcription factor n=1 Tax=Penicillium angulare TaxID=116970 RepID=A0A9W9FTY6_9EURO|nr:hypothetical protein N7456_003035 [Penicillium angulare]